MEQKSKIFCDMDGVLVDLFSGIVNSPGFSHLHINDVKDFVQNSSFRKEEQISDLLSDNPEFWQYLPQMDECDYLWENLSQTPLELNILTCPWDSACAEGKRKWVDRYLDPNPNEVFIERDKYHFAKINGVRNILIDDFNRHIDLWTAHGGLAIHYKDVQQVLDDLNEFLNKPTVYNILV